MGRVWVERVKSSKIEDSYENLALLMGSDMITVLRYPKLQAEIDVFKSGCTFDGGGLRPAGCTASGSHALCLVTYDLSPS
jgi:hypothetical protein